jgi:hypothetical protein
MTLTLRLTRSASNSSAIEPWGILQSKLEALSNGNVASNAWVEEVSALFQQHHDEGMTNQTIKMSLDQN